MKIRSEKLGLAIGGAGVILYLMCMCVILIAGNKGTIWLFNSLLHGIDVRTIIQLNVPLLQSIYGIVLTFCIGWLMGFLIGKFYNWQIKID